MILLASSTNFSSDETRFHQRSIWAILGARVNPDFDVDVSSVSEKPFRHIDVSAMRRVVKGASADFICVVYASTLLVEKIQQIYPPLPGGHLQGRHLKSTYRVNVSVLTVARQNLARAVELAVLDRQHKRDVIRIAFSLRSHSSPSCRRRELITGRDSHNARQRLAHDARN